MSRSPEDWAAQRKIAEQIRSHMWGIIDSLDLYEPYYNGDDEIVYKIEKETKSLLVNANALIGMNTRSDDQ